jgi:hypothetical protein
MWSDEARQASAAARGGAHQAGVNQIGRPVLSAKAVQIATSHPDGFSVKPNGAQPTKGYMVALPGHSLVVDAAVFHSPAGAAMIQAHATAHADVLKQSGTFLGGWTDRSTGKTYVEVSHNIQNRNAAIRTGQNRNQKAIYDVRKGRDISTGGTGE